LNQVAVFVDAGYFWVQGAMVLQGQRCERDILDVNFAALRQAILDLVAKAFPGQDLLRVYWYDGTGDHGQKTSTHLAIDELDDFKLRLGSRNGVGTQKGVDGLIIADMISLAHARAMRSVLLVSGDGDLLPGVCAIQQLGLRAHLLTMGPHGATSLKLRAEVDGKTHWGHSDIAPFLSCKTAGEGVEPPSSDGPGCDHTLDAVAHEILRGLDGAQREACHANGTICHEVDRQLLLLAHHRLGRHLSDPEKRYLRQAFKGMLALPSTRPVLQDAAELVGPCPALAADAGAGRVSSGGVEESDRTVA
jgi:uncharacterized LabA/DUF88 family protein